MKPRPGPSHDEPPVNAGDLDFAQLVRPGDMVVWGQGSAEPTTLVRTLLAQRHSVGGRFTCFAGICLTEVLDLEIRDCVDLVSYCGFGPLRRFDAAGLLSVVPVHYSQLPYVLAHGELACDVLLLQVSRGRDGELYASLAHDYAAYLIGHARTVVAQLNSQAPPAPGGLLVPSRAIDVLVRSDSPIVGLPAGMASPAEQEVARRVAELVEDRSTIQVGIGSLPATLLAGLASHQGLGIHSGALVDEMVDLVAAGAVDNAHKSVDVGVSVGGLVLGSRMAHAMAARDDFVLRPIAHTHALSVLAAQPRFTSLNSAVEVDLSGSVNTEVARGRYVGAVGGSLDFLRGANASKGGKGIIALTARAPDGSPRIVSRLTGPTSIPRSDTSYVVTEFGVAQLGGRSLDKRNEALVAIAHPDDREQLERAAQESARAR